MKHFFIEEYMPNIRVSPEDKIIALTPSACYNLEKAGIRYSIIEDYYDEAELLKQEPTYFKDQLKWFEEFDKMLFEIFPEAKAKNLKVASSYYVYIKEMVDALILRCKAIASFMDKARPDSVIYVSAPWKEDSIRSAQYPLPFRRGQSLFSRIVPLFCKDRGISFQRVILKDEKYPNIEKLHYRNIFSAVKTYLVNNKHIVNLYNDHSIFRFNVKRSAVFSDQSRLNILILNMNSYVRSVAKDLLEDGHNVFYKKGDDIVRIAPNSFGLMGNITDSILKSQEDIAGVALDKEAGIIKWINGYCGIDVSNVILPRLLYIINEFCPQLISLVDKYISFYDNNQIDLVFTIHMVTAEDHAAIIATRYATRTKSACLSHGDCAFDLEVEHYATFLPYHLYFTSNYEMEEYVKGVIRIRNLSTKVFQYPNSLNMLVEIGNRRPKNKKRSHKMTCTYVPNFYSWDSIFWNEARCPDTWYFKWHKKLLELFSSRSDFNFIWKALPSSGDTPDPISNLICDRKYKNIKYATEPFLQWANKSDVVLLDYPSSALYEAAMIGLPVMSLYFSSFVSVRKSVIELFGKSLQSFSNFDEGIKKIENFLDSDSAEFTVSIPYSKDPITNIFKSFKLEEQFK